MKSLLLKAGLVIATSIGGYFFSRVGLLPPVEVVGSENEGGDALLQEDSNIAEDEERCSKSVVYQVPSVVGDESSVDQVSPSVSSSGDGEDYLLPEFHELVREEFEMAVKKLETSVAPEESETNVEEVEGFGSCKKKEGKDLSTTDEEIENMKRLVHSLKEREKELEFQLRGFHGWKEEQSIVSELENRLKINSVETKALTMKMESLKASNGKLEAQLSNYLGVEAELDEAKEKMKLLERKMASHLEQAKESVEDLQERVSTLQASEEGRRDRGEELKQALTKLKVLEDEAVNLRNQKWRLERENLDLVDKLKETEVLIEEGNHLRNQNKELLEQIDELQINLSGDVEELVYLKWLNACLRYELRDYKQPEGRRIARELPKSPTMESEEKAKHLIFEYAKSASNESIMPDYDSEYGSCSQSSLLTEIGDCDDSSVSTKNSGGSRKTKIFGKLKRLVSGKGAQGKSSSSSSPNGAFKIYDDETLGRQSFDSASSCMSMDNARVTLSQLMNLDSKAEEHSLEEAKLTKQERCRSDLGSSHGRRRSMFGKRRSSSQNSSTRGDSCKEEEELKKFAKALMNTSRSSQLSRRK